MGEIDIMCVAGCKEVVRNNLSRRQFFKGAASMAALSAVGCHALQRPNAFDRSVKRRSFSKSVDLSHTLSDNFATFSGQSQFSMETIATVEKNGYFVNRWNLIEHTGTHIDAPIHFSPDGKSVDEIPVDDLVVPLAIIDIREKAHANPNAQLTVEDINAWEATHGPLEPGSCVAMNSGWDAYVNKGTFRNADSKGVMHFPGFHVEACQFLIEERNASGIMVDTLSLDYGQSTDFAVHTTWLPSGRWGVECVANLGMLPDYGATVVVAAPKIKGASGGLSRVMALV